MDIELVDPELRTAAKRVSMPDLGGATRIVTRLLTGLIPPAPTPGVAMAKVREGDVRVRVFRPEARPTGPALLWIHGGGLVIGTAKQDDRPCGETAAELGITVVSAEYGLAPEHRFPVALDQLAATWRWMRAHAAELGVDPDRIAIGGESAGGGLAAALVQRIHDEGGPQPIAQWLFCPMLDDRTAANRELDAVGHFVWSNRNNRVGWEAYLGVPAGSPDVPEYAAPGRRADLSGLPPAWLSAGAVELFHDEIVDYATRLRAAGVPTELVEVAGAPHAPEAWARSSAVAQRLTASARGWLKDALS